MSSPDKAGVPQPKLAYRLLFFGNMLLGTHAPMGNPGYHLPNGFSACFKSHASTLAVFTPEGVRVYLMCGCGWLPISAKIPVKVQLSSRYVKNFGPRDLGFERPVSRSQNDVKDLLLEFIFET